MVAKNFRGELINIDSLELSLVNKNRRTSKPFESDVQEMMGCFSSKIFEKRVKP